MQLKEMYEKQTELLTKSEAIRSKYAGDKFKDMAPAETEEWTKILDEADQLTDKIKAEERHQQIAAFQKAVPDEVVVVDDKTGKTLAKGNDVPAMKAWNNFLMKGEGKTGDDDIKLIRAASVFEHPDFRGKGLAIGDPVDGGYLVAPMQWINEMIKELNALMAIRSISRTFTVADASSLGVPNLDTDLDDFDWTTELDAGELDDIDVGKRTLTPHPLAKRVQISKSLLRKAMMDPEALVRERAQYKLSRTQEKAFMTGSGAQRPLGVFTASTDGIPTTQDFTSAASGVVDGDDMIDAVATLESQYLTRATWVLHRLWLAYIRKLKDDAGNYIWTPYDFQGKAIVGANPGTILGLPYRLSEDAPSTVSAGNYAAVLGDFQYYWIVDALTMQVQVLTEIAARTNQNEYHFRSETDAAPVLKKAFIRLKMKA
jgi:HK97 family phage major capsid protein